MQVSKYIIIAIITIVSLHTANTQLIIQAGLNVSSWRVSSTLGSYESASKIGFHAGVTYSKTIGTNFQFRPGIFYSQKGAKEYTDPTTLNYLDLPFSFVYQKNPSEGFFASGGLYFAHLLSADLFGNDIKDNFNSFDMGINLGAGFDFKVMIIGFQGGIGLVNIFKSDGTANEITPTNSNGQLYLAIKL